MYIKDLKERRYYVKLLDIESLKIYYYSNLRISKRRIIESHARHRPGYVFAIIVNVEQYVHTKYFTPDLSTIVKSFREIRSLTAKFKDIPDCTCISRYNGSFFVFSLLLFFFFFFFFFLFFYLEIRKIRGDRIVNECANRDGARSKVK